MRYGFFDLENKEYVIERPDTPLPWINYLGAEEYCGLMSNTGGGYSFFQDAKEQRITRYRYNNVPKDRGGRYIYIRDNKSEEFWSASWQPVLKPLVNNRYEAKDGKYWYECRVGLGYTTINSSYDNIDTETTYVVPLGENLEIWMMTIKNRGNAERDLSAFSFVEFCLWDALNDMTDFQYNLNIGETEYKDGIIYHTTSYRAGKNLLAYFASSEKVKGFDSQRDGFMGGYGSFENPRAVAEGKCNNTIACGWSPVGSHHLSFKLLPGQEKTIIFVLGVERKKEKVKKIVDKYTKKSEVVKKLDELKQYWDESLNKFVADTPDQDINNMLSVWNQYQCRTTFNWSRSASYYEAGIGRGMGFRDSNQDTIGFCHQIPEKVKERIIDLASTQFVAGDAFHQYSPLTKKGNGSGYGDDHLWLILSTANYVKETGDMKFLSQKVPFANGKAGTMYDHLKRAVDYSFKNVGPHGLPLIGFADWNDCLNLNWVGKGGVAQSVMIAQQLVYSAREMIEIAKRMKNKKDETWFKKVVKTMSDRINKAAWDGAWYVRAFDTYKKVVGSKKNKEGKIFLETQPWAVMSGVAQGERAKKCMDSVKKNLASEHGIMILQPSFKKFYPQLGSISVYPQGLKENGAIFCHPNPWAMVAECILGRGELAYEYYKAILPAAKNEMSDVRKTEPYVYCQMIAGEEHCEFGEGKNAWLTGTAAWNYVAGANWILGVRPEYDGLMVDPCIPKKWKGFKVKRTFRGVDYYIDVKNPKGKNKGVKNMFVDGKEVAGNIIPPQKGAKEVQVEIVMG